MCEILDSLKTQHGDMDVYCGSNPVGALVVRTDIIRVYPSLNPVRPILSIISRNGWTLP